MQAESAKPNPLRQAVQLLPSVGPSRIGMMRRLGIRRAGDLLFLFPRSYEEPAQLQQVKDFVENTRCSFVGTVVDMDERVTQSGKHMLGVQVDPDGGGGVRLLWFNQPFRKKELAIGQRLLVTGVMKSTVLNWETVQPQIQVVVEGDDLPVTTAPQPVYPLTEGLRQPVMRSLMRDVLPDLISHVEEVLPPRLREQLDVASIAVALNDVHFPETLSAAEAARRRFKVQELLVLQLAITIQRRAREIAARAPVCTATGKIHARILNRLPHTPTIDQAHSIEEIGQDMSRETPMNRLLQGDVGSGKTVVAQYAMLLAVAHGCQAALMAPTEVLARQHVSTLNRSLASSRVRVGLLTASMPAQQRNQTLEKLAAGELDVLVGTQSLLSDQVRFHRLGLVVVDEQHKFGVMQRAKLRTDDAQPHYLVLSATPIPRTIAMTVFGDLDVSTIRSKPPGRAAVHTYIAGHDHLEAWWQFVDKQIEAGRQAYVIAPRVASLGEPDEPASVEGLYQQLRTGTLAHRRLALLHGRMDGAEKEAALSKLASGETQILVATTVVEVGIDVPNATVMTILDADKLGLSQLHQLRGRVSRGTHAGYVTAVATKGCDNRDNQRLKAFEKSDDGFELAEMDLAMRGPGDLLGTSQSGLPTLRIASLVDDGPLLELAQGTARALLAEDPTLEAADLQLLRKQTLRRYGDSMELGDVG